MGGEVLLSVGDRFAERYLVREKLGEGGMGCVYEVHDELLDESVALKVGRPGASDVDTAYQEALKHEVTLARKVTHPGVARIYDLGIDAGRLYITMERIRGESLSERLAQSTIEAAEAMWMASQIAAGLAAAHDAQVIHSDLKPSNIMISEGEAKKVVLLDFGVAKAMGSRGRGGTLEYMSPEQVLDELLTGASDVYALGLVLYRMLTGRSPFPQRTTQGRAIARIDGRPEPLPDTFPKTLREFVDTLLQNAPEDRPSAREVAEGLSAMAFRDAKLGIPREPIGLGRRADLSSLSGDLGPRLAHARRRLLLVGHEREILLASEEALQEMPDLDLALAMRAVVLVRIYSRLYSNDDYQNLGGDSAAAVSMTLRRAPHLPESHLADAAQAMNAGDFGYAVRALQRALERDPLFLPAHQMLFRLELEAGIPVIERQRLIESLDPQMLWATPWIARELIFLGRDEDALALLRDAAISGSDYGAIWSTRVRHCIWQRDAAATEALLGELPMLNDFSPVLKHMLEFSLQRASMQESSALHDHLLELPDSPGRKAFYHQLWAELWADQHPEAAAHQISMAAMQPLADLRWLLACPAFRDMRDAPCLPSVIALVEERLTKAFAPVEASAIPVESTTTTTTVTRAKTTTSTVVEIPTALERKRR